MFVDRDNDGHVVGLYACQQREGQDFEEGATLWVDPRRAAQAQIDALERAQLLPRITREFMLGVAEAQYTPEQRAQNFGYNALKALDDQIAALRALL